MQKLKLNKNISDKYGGQTCIGTLLNTGLKSSLNSENFLITRQPMASIKKCIPTFLEFHNLVILGVICIL